MAAVIGSLRAELSATIAKFEDDMGKAADSVKGFAREFTKVANDLKRTGAQMQSIGTSLSKTVTLPLVAIGAAVAKVGIDFESAFAGVRKTVDGVVDDMGNLTETGREIQQGFRDLAKAIPVSVNELARLGEAAGALGIPKDQIVEFARVMAELGVTTNLTSDDAATAIAKIQNVFGAAGKDTERFASTLVALGNAGASTEAEIVTMAQRIAAAGHVVGLTQGQVLAFGSALSSVGIEAEAGGTAISKVFIELASAVSGGGSKLQAFADITQQTGAQFAQAFKTDAAGATTSFIEGLGRIQKSGGDLFGTLESLGLTEVRLRNALLSAAGAGDLLRSSLDLQDKAWRENTALTKEAEQRFKTTESQLTLLWNRIKDVGITLFNSLKPAIESAIGAMNGLLPIAERLAQAFAALPGNVQLGVIGLLGFAAALGPIIFVAGQLVSSLGVLIGAFGKTGVATRAIVGVLTTVEKVFGAFSSAILVDGAVLVEWGKSVVTISPWLVRLGSVLGTVVEAVIALANPVTLTIAGIAALGLAVAALTGHWGDVKAALGGAWQALKDIGVIVVYLGKEAIGGAVGYVKDFILWLGNLAAAVTGPVIDAFKVFVGWLKDHIPGWLIALIDKFKEFLSWTKKVASEGAASLHEYAEGAREMGDGFEESLAGAQKHLESLKKSTANAVDPVMARATAAIAEELARVALESQKTKSGFDGLTASLEAARKEIAGLSQKEAKALAAAIRSGAFSMDDLQKATRLSENALKLFKEQLEEGDKAIKTASEDWKKLQERMAEQSVKLGGHIFKDYADAIERDVHRATESLQTFLDMIDETRRTNFTMGQIGTSGLPGAVGESKVGAILEDIADFERAMREATFNGPQMPEFVQAFRQRINAGMTETFQQLPNVILQAIQGGGQVWDAVASAIGAVAGNNLGTKLSGIIGGKFKRTLEDGTEVTTDFGKALGGLAQTATSVGGALLGKAGGILGAIGQGASIGSIAGPWGAAIGAAAGAAISGIKKLMGGPEWQKLGKGIGKEFGAAIPEEMLKAWEAESKQFGRQATTLLHLDEIVAQAGGVAAVGFQKVTTSARDLFSMIETGKLTTESAGKTFDSVFGQLADQIKPGGLVSKGFLELIDLNNRFGTNAASVAKFIGDQIQTNLIGGLNRFIKSDVPIASQGVADALSASLGVAFSQLQTAGVPILDIVNQLEPIVAALGEKFTKAGLEGSAAFGNILSLVTLAKDEIAGPAIEAVSGLGQVLAGLHNIGQLDQATFAGLTDQIATTFNNLIAGGKDGKAAMTLMQQPLQTVWQLAKDFGLAVGDSVQALLDQAEAAGVVGDKQRPIQEQMLLATERIADAVEGIGKAFGYIPAQAQNAANGINNALAGIRTPTIDIPVRLNTDGVELPHVAPEWQPFVDPLSFATGSGGIRDFKGGTPAWLHGREGVFTEDQIAAMQQSSRPTTPAEPVAMTVNVSLNVQAWDGTDVRRVAMSDTFLDAVATGIAKKARAKFRDAMDLETV